MQQLLGRLCAFVLAFLVMTGGARATSSNTDLSDIWWNPNESGWGLQMVNTGAFIFATIYVYGPNGSPTWYTGQLTNTGGPTVVYTGPLYATIGPYFGGFFNPNAVSARQVGTMTFTGTTTSAGQVTYSVDGVVVTKAVQRLPLTMDNYNGNYTGTFADNVSGCFNPALNGTGTLAVNISITQNAQSMAITVATSTGSCSIVGAYSQLGRMGLLSGIYSCNGSAIGTATLFEMNNVIRMFMARFQAFSPASGCNEVGEITGLIPR